MDKFLKNLNSCKTFKLNQATLTEKALGLGGRTYICGRNNSHTNFSPKQEHFQFTLWVSIILMPKPDKDNIIKENYEMGLLNSVAE